MEVVAWKPLCKAARADCGIKILVESIVSYAAVVCTRKKRNGDARNAPPLKIRGNNYYS